MSKKIIRSVIALAIAFSAITDTASATLLSKWTVGTKSHRIAQSDPGAAIVRLSNQYRAIELQYANEEFELHVMKRDWKVRVGETFDVTIVVDHKVAAAIELEGTAYNHKGIFSGLKFELSTDEVEQLKTQLAAGSKVYIYFPNSNERMWEGSLKGSSAALQQWSKQVGDGFAEAKANEAAVEKLRNDLSALGTKLAEACKAGIDTQECKTAIHDLSLKK
jgi:hypothetical protein